MRIVHYLRRFVLADGGVVRAVVDMCSLLAAHGHDVTVLTCGDEDVPLSWKEPTHGAPRLVRIPSPAAGFGRFTRSQLATISPHMDSADVLHIHGCWEMDNVQLARAASRRGVPYVISIHGMLDDWSMSQKSFKKRLYLALGGRRVLEQAGVVHCTAAAEYEQSKKWYPRGTGMVVPLAFDMGSYTELPGPQLANAMFGPAGTGAIAPNVPLVLFLSRVHPKKGVDILIDAMAELNRRGIACQVVIAGSGEIAYVSALARRIQSLGLQDRIKFVGIVTGSSKISLYQRADILAIPTSQENFGFVFLESLACGTPVITTRGVDIWPELSASQGALIIDRTTKVFADAIACLISDPDRATRMGVAGRCSVASRFSSNEILAAFLAMYRKAVGSLR